MAFLLDGKTIQQGVAFADKDGNQYPANWLNLSSAEEKEAIGLTEVADPEIFDNRFYWDAGLPKALEDKDEEDADGKPILDKDGKQLVTKGLKTQFIDQVNKTANSLLSQTDWYIIRKSERAIDVPADVVSARAKIVAESNRLVDAINAVKDIEALIEVLNTQNWQ